VSWLLHFDHHPCRIRSTGHILCVVRMTARLWNGKRIAAALGEKDAAVQRTQSCEPMAPPPNCSHKVLEGGHIMQNLPKRKTVPMAPRGQGWSPPVMANKQVPRGTRWHAHSHPPQGTHWHAHPPLRANKHAHLREGHRAVKGQLAPEAPGAPGALRVWAEGPEGGGIQQHQPCHGVWVGSCQADRQEAAQGVAHHVGGQPYPLLFGVQRSQCVSWMCWDCQVDGQSYPLLCKRTKVARSHVGRLRRCELRL
jgi:hypothetical protein